MDLGKNGYTIANNASNTSSQYMQFLHLLNSNVCIEFWPAQLFQTTEIAIQQKLQFSRTSGQETMALWSLVNLP